MTKTELVNYFKARIFPNGAKSVSAAKHQEAGLAVIDELYARAPQVDLASTSEQLTGKIYNGKPVYFKKMVVNLAAPLNAGVMYDAGIITTGVTYAWIDYSMSYQSPSGEHIPLTGMAGSNDQHKALAYLSEANWHIYKKCRHS